MRIPPRYKITPEIIELIAKIDANRYFFSSFELPAIVKDKIQRVSLLKSSLFSARIEGNPLTMNEIETSSDKQKKIEVFNILKAIKFIDKEISTQKKITKRLILQLHKTVMDRLMSRVGFFRTEMGAIFNRDGIAVYLPPPPLDVALLIEGLLKYINSKEEKFPLVSALVTHLIFEKIHPFIDGNGRVGRLLIFAVLKTKGYSFGFSIPFEEYLDENKEDYYYYLDLGLKNTHSYLIFMLKAFYHQTEKIKKFIQDELKRKETLMLPPRQEEIFQIIRDHAVITFDFLRRRFMKIPERTLRYDLKKLKDLKLIIKLGNTKGSYYKVKN